MALQNPQTKLWDIYGSVVKIGPHRRYFVKTRSGRVLTRNHRFLRLRTPASLQLSSSVVQYHDSEKSPSPRQSVQEKQSSHGIIVPPTDDQTPQDPSGELRRPQRPHKLNKRLIANPRWP